MTSRPLSLRLLGGRYAVVRLEPDAPLPDWLASRGFSSVTRTGAELSIVSEGSRVPASLRAERDWRCLEVFGPLDFAEVGILAELAGALAASEVSLFALSTFDTDYLLVREADLERAIAALRARGHAVDGA